MNRLVKRLIAGLALFMAAGLALALPAPHDIEAAVNAGRYTEAETLLREVIREKPGSARAHYELGQVLAHQGRGDDARLELQAAQLIDPQLRFARDPQHFRDLLARIPAGGGRAPAAHVASPATPGATTPAASAHAGAESGLSLLPFMVVGGLAALVGVVVLLFRVASARQGGGFGATPAYAGNAYGSTYAPAPSRELGLGSAMLGGLAGMAAGYGIAKAMEHGDTPAAHADATGFTPVDSAPDYGAFDTGSGGDTWDDGSRSDDEAW